MSDRPFVSLTTDFGTAYTAICAGVVHRLAPEATVLVLDDDVTPYAVVEGALLLRQGLLYLPVGVHVGVVDPGVGTARRPVAIATGRGDVLVGPDNGLLIPAADELGGVTRAHVLEDPAYRLPNVSTSFHGRDIFSPAAAHLARGLDVAALGPSAEPETLVRLPLPDPVVSAGRLDAPVLYADRFGSLILAADRDDLVTALGTLQYGDPLELGWTDADGAPRTERLAFAATYGGVAEGGALVWVDSSGLLGVAVNQGSAVARFGRPASFVFRTGVT
ncbi:SAM hydrolase/SAM-dependent halogenase family protein [Spirillospora sp. CA-294931]|uniref:SAM hydrolase/SAM-dependent halogenase family protein n=1 Tax=Spirillospora sp. CA-294931 TaxID=3240042 RepID=UPI003D8B3953